MNTKKLTLLSAVILFVGCSSTQSAKTTTPPNNQTDSGEGAPLQAQPRTSQGKDNEIDTTAKKKKSMVAIVGFSSGNPSQPPNISTQESNPRGLLSIKTAQSGTGIIDVEAVKNTLNRKGKMFQQCYETALKNDPNIKGNMVLQLDISERGKISEAKALSDDMGESVVKCIVSVCNKVRFPRPDNGTATVKTSFTFQPAP